MRFESTLFRLAFVILAGVGLVGCRAWQTNKVPDRLLPSNNRDWSPDLAVLPTAEVNGDQITIRNIRRCKYLTNDDYVVTHYDRTFSLDDVDSVDFIVVPFQGAPALAHTMLSFGINDGSYIGVSVEIRTEKNETYSPLLGISRQFEITYVIADERDLIGVRTRHRNADVYVFPTIATAEQSQQLLLDVLTRVNKLAESPEFYDTIQNNCTTNLAQHINNLTPGRIKYDWQVLLPGFSAKYAYDLGLLDNAISFEELQGIAYVNDLAEEHFDSPEFSQLIRSRRNSLGRLSEARSARAPVLGGAGAQYLDRSQLR